MTPAEALTHPFLFPGTFDPYMSVTSKSIIQEKLSLELQFDDFKKSTLEEFNIEKSQLKQDYVSTLY